MTLYMHTLDGKPASFYPRDGVCFTHRRIKLAASLRQIRREQKIDQAMRANDYGTFKRGYVTVSI